MNPVDMVKIAKKYTGLWIAFNQQSKPIASGQTLKEVVKEAQQKGCRNPVITKIPTENFGYIL